LLSIYTNSLLQTNSYFIWNIFYKSIYILVLCIINWRNALPYRYWIQIFISEAHEILYYFLYKIKKRNFSNIHFLEVPPYFFYSLESAGLGQMRNVSQAKRSFHWHLCPAACLLLWKLVFRWRRRWTAYMYLYLYPNLKLWMGWEYLYLWHGRGNSAYHWRRRLPAVTGSCFWLFWFYILFRLLTTQFYWTTQ